MSVFDDDEAEVVRRLTLDARATIGPGFETCIQRSASHARLFPRDRDSFIQYVVDDVQQYFHDTFVDTTWPSCPRHPNHPLWFRNGWWWCERDSEAIARLGELGAEATGAD